MVGQDGTVRSVGRVVSLIELLGERKRPLRLVEIAQALEIPKSTAHGLLQTLVSRDVVVKDEAQRYRLGMRLFSLASTVLEVGELRELARPEMELASADTGSTCNLATLDGHHVMYLEKIEDRSSPVRLVTHVGTRLPAHATALGKVLVAGLPRKRRDAWVAEHDFTAVTAATITDVDRFSATLAEVADIGWATDRHEFHPAIWGVAAPILDHSDTTVAALSLTSLDPDADLTALGTRVRAAADAISADLRPPTG